MSEQEKNRWYRVPEVWLMLVLLGGMVVGSFGLLYEALHHYDPSIESPAPIATRVPPPSHSRPTDSATP
jgi:hypothetical protein